jgi:AcrR family transcriptional regulator
MGRHRHVERGYARGEETRARIIAAAVRLFGEHGFTGASTRDIARDAGVNAPALQYYFDNKEGLYLACVEHIVSQVWEYLSPTVSAAEEMLAREAGDEDLIEAYCAIQARVIELKFTVKEADDWRMFMARQQTGAGPAAGFDMFQERITRRISGVTAGIVGRLLNKPGDDDEVLIRSMALHGQLMVFQVMRRSALATLSWDMIDARRLELLKRVIGDQTGALLRSMAASRSRHGGAKRRE